VGRSGPDHFNLYTYWYTLTVIDEKKGPARERLLRATAELIYTRGIEATGVDAIAASAGVTKRTLYQHFRSKDDLVGAALAASDGAVMAALRAAVQRRIAKGERPIEALFAHLERLAALPAFHGCAFLNAGLEMREPDHPVRSPVRSHTDARRALVEELARADGVTDELTIDALSLLVEGAFALSASRRDPSVVARAAQAAHGLVQRALRGRDDRYSY
jgi:AcrR family transcriptional regulator